MGNRRSLGGLTVGTFAVLVLTFIELAAGQSSLPSSRYSPSSRASYQGFSPYGFYESPESEVLPTLSRNLEQPMGSAMGNDAGGQVIQDGPVLSLVDCEPASDEEDGLSCDKVRGNPSGPLGAVKVLQPLHKLASQYLTVSALEITKCRLLWTCFWYGVTTCNHIRWSGTHSQSLQRFVFLVVYGVAFPGRLHTKPFSMLPFFLV